MGASTKQQFSDYPWHNGHNGMVDCKPKADSRPLLGDLPKDSLSNRS
jgi:hypothetical protein